MTPLEEEAQRQAEVFLRTYDPLGIRRDLLLPQRSPWLPGARQIPGMCMRDDSAISFDFLDGEFDLDDPLAIAYLNSLMAAGAGAQGAPAQKSTALPGWIRTWQDATGSSAQPGSVDRVWGEFLGATIGPGNILASAAGAVEGGALTVKKMSTNADIERAAARISERAARGVQVNPNVRVYDANALARQKMRARKQTPGKHLMKPRLKIKMERVSTTILKTGGMSAKASTGGIRGGVAYSPATANQAASISASRWAAGNALRHLNAPGVPAALAFVPSGLIDAVDAYESAADGSSNWNGRKFLVSSAKSQSANVVGFGVGLGVTKGLILLVGAGVITVSGGGIVLIALGLGITAQWVFNASGGGDAAGKLADNVLPRQ